MQNLKTKCPQRMEGGILPRHHNICTKDQVMDIMKKLALIVDNQNIKDNNYQPMGANFEKSIAFATACDLVFKGREQPSGYTEPLLHQRRQQKKLSSQS